MKNKYLLSIIIPVYNVAPFLSRCLDSILPQIRNLPVEVIAVDDGSTDESLNILNMYRGRLNNAITESQNTTEKDAATESAEGVNKTLEKSKTTQTTRLLVISQENKGTAGARNTGLAKATGKYVWFVDPDDRLSADAIPTILKNINDRDKNKDHPDIFLFDAYEEKNGRSISWEHFDKPAFIAKRKKLRILQRGALYCKDAKSNTPLSAPWDKVYRKKFLNSNNLVFPEDLRVLDDMVFNMKAFGAADSVCYIKEKIYHYIRNDEGITASYTPDRTEKDLAVWRNINSYIKEQKTQGALNDNNLRLLVSSFEKRIIRSYAISLKLQIFNISNPDTLKEKICSALELMKKPYYREAFMRTKINEIEPMLRPILIIGKIINRRLSSMPKQGQKKVLYITTKEPDYIRNAQDIRILRESGAKVSVIGSYEHGYIKRLASIYPKLLATDLRSFDEIFIGFAPQLIIPLFYSKIKHTNIPVTTDFFISLYDTFCFDRKRFSSDSIVGKLLFRLDRYTLSKADNIICDTKAHAQYFCSDLYADPKKIKVRYLEADKSIYDPKLYKNADRYKTLKTLFGKQIKEQNLSKGGINSKKIVLYFGSVLPLQGTDIVLKAMQKLCDTGEYLCIFVGPLDPSKRLNVPNFLFTKHLSQKDLAKLISVSDLCLAGHFNGRIEKAKRTIPGKAFIFNAMKKPMILGDTPANHEVFKESEKIRFVPLEDVEALYGAICMML